MPKNLSLISICILILSCHQQKTPDEVKHVLNRIKNYSLKKVLNHYNSPKDSVKFKAACFLIANMGNKYYYKGSIVEHFDKLYELSSEKSKLKNKALTEKEIEFLIDSIVNTRPVNGTITTAWDIDNITFRHLINTIDQSFSMWQKMPYSKHVPFNQFLNFILPYRAKNETLEDVQEKIGKKYSWVLDSMHDKSDPVEACIIFNNELKTWFQYIYNLRKCPTSILSKAKCTNNVN